MICSDNTYLVCSEDFLAPCAIELRHFSEHFEFKNFSSNFSIITEVNLNTNGNNSP